MVSKFLESTLQRLCLGIGVKKYLPERDPIKHRSWMMSRVRGRDTGPELELRRELRRNRYPIKTNDKSLPGTPDVVIPALRRVIFVHGCFWHSHDCKRGGRPQSNRSFWNKKLDANKARDKLHYRLLRRAGWKVSVIWQCGLKEGISRAIKILDRSKLRTSQKSYKRQKMSRKKTR